MKWITRDRPKIDRIACPWLIRNFIDKKAEFIYVPFEQVIPKAEELNAIPYDVPGVKFTHRGTYCTFDVLAREYKIKDEAIFKMAEIIRAADTDHHELSSESAGLWAISAGLSHNFRNDHELLEKGMFIYDALYSWARHLQRVRHGQQPFENLVLALNSFLKARSGKRVPTWAKELKEIIQDQIDTNLSLKEISSDLEINPSYLSREFSKYFEDLSFGEYIRKLRIEKAVELMKDPVYSLTEIAYLTGFSDQSHFSRIFKKQMGQTPLAFRKKKLKK